jgi:aspartokinase
MVSLGASEVNLSIIISEENYADAVMNLHSEFFDKGLDTDIFEELKR